MKHKTPAARSSRGLETLAGNLQAPLTVAAYRAQLIAARYAMPLNHAAIVASLAFGGVGHG